MKDLYVFWDDNSSFSDISLPMRNYKRDDETLDLNSAEDYLYIGLYKPFNSVYAEFTTANTNSNSFAAEYYDGTSFTSLSNFTDQSLGFTRSGFLKWDRPSDWTANTINSQEAFWIRLRPSADHSSTVMRGCNIVYSDDNDLAGEIRSISSFLKSSDTSFIVNHEAARDDIIQQLRNKGKIKRDADNNLSKITKWDLLDSEEMRQASKYLTLHKIFFESSDSIDGKWQQRADFYRDKYGESVNVLYLTLDTDDDGVIDSTERLNISRAQVLRL